MNGFQWTGVIVITFFTTLSLSAWFSMAVPYFDNAPYFHDLRRNPKLAWLIGLVVFVLFFTVFYLGAQHLDVDSSGPLLVLVGLVLALPVSLMIGTETWERYNSRRLNAMPGVRAVGVSTLTGMVILGVATLVVVLIL
ncbi:MAG: hypothetical protein GYB65_05080 [Chloroflexi bacterium]|nr:hypothetical protein [Chloroflexota bacterium]